MKLKYFAGKIIFYIAFMGFLFGCATTGVPTPKERTSIQDGKLAIVLLRIEYELADGNPIDPFKGWDSRYWLNIGSGSVLVGGKTERVKNRFISPETRKQGWTYLILEPGIHYLVFAGPVHTWERKNLNYGPRFKVNIPLNNQLVYVGTLNLHCPLKPEFWVNNEIICWSSSDIIKAIQTEVRDKKLLLEKLTNEYLSDFGSPRTLLMQRVIRTTLSED